MLYLLYVIEFSRALLLSDDGWKQLQSGLDYVNSV